MKEILTATTLAAGISLATTSASAQYDIGSEIARGVINGIILGGRVGPDFYGFVPADIESRMMASASAQIAARRRPGYARMLITTRCLDREAESRGQCSKRSMKNLPKGEGVGRHDVARVRLVLAASSRRDSSTAARSRSPEDVLELGHGSDLTSSGVLWFLSRDAGKPYARWARKAAD
jgi:hypothetical protein